MMEMWVVYDHPRDHPDGFIARRWLVTGEGGVATPVTRTAATLDLLRAQLRRGLVRMQRHPDDDTKIVEIWL